MRITGGTNRNREVRVPAGARPSGGRIREALFSIWAGRLQGARFLDLFAGSGIVGLEALSRGVTSATFVEKPGRALRVLEANIRALGEEHSVVVGFELPDRDAGKREQERGTRFAASLGRDFDLVFADPPYAFEAWKSLLAIIDRVLAPDGEAAIEHSRRIDLPNRAGSLEAHDSRAYGESTITLYARARADRGSARTS